MAPMKIKSVIAGIQNKKLKEGYVAVTYDDSKFSFYFPLTSSILVSIFSNRSGQIRGITEFNLKKRTRETCELEVALEIMAKIKERLPTWKIVTEGVDEAVRAKELEIEKSRSQIPEIKAELNPKYKLFHFQNESVKHLIKTNGLAILALDMGLGKSCVTLAWAVMHKKRILVVCPKTVRKTWTQEALKFFPNYYKEKVIELKPMSSVSDLKKIRLASVNYESLEKFLPVILDAGFDAIVCDESQRFKSPKAKITKTLYKIKDAFKHRILLSGTVIKNKPLELLTQTNFIETGFLTEKELKEGTIGALWNKLRSSIYISYTKKEVLPDLPEKITQIIEMDVVGMPPMPKSIGDVSHTRILAAIAKVPSTVSFVREILDASDSCCIVFTESKEAAKKIAEMLGNKVALLHHGEMSDGKREAVKEEFQNETSLKRVFVSTRQSVGVGVTLTRADKVIFNDLAWTSVDVLQAENRAHRIGTKNCVNVYWITAQNCDWDNRITDIIRNKYELCKKINEGKQLTDDEQRWLSEPISLSDLDSHINL
jgi:SNF2 family DNA or RNA helicase